ncbi:putative ubiquitin carrier protein [Xylariaceae sp. FL0255]|nr:putative ubiquitin carrier protein [Xylariaceae sp. FL0255]
MASNPSRRIAKELRDMAVEAAASGINAESATGNDSDLSHLKAYFPGPPSTPYERGHFVVDVKIPPNYPFSPPTMKFDTKVWHPNVSSQTGAICIDTLKEAWSPVFTIKSTLLSLQALFESPEPTNPQDAEVAKMMLNDPEGFNKKAHDWAVEYARAPHNPKYQEISPRPAAAAQVQDDEDRYQGYNRDMIQRFVSMGFDIDRVVEAFQFFGIDPYDGEDYELEPEYMGDITARLLGEP